MRGACVLALACVAASLGGRADAQTSGTKGSYGAIAYEASTRSVGYVFNYSASRAAKIEALKQCGHEKCEVVVNFRSGCGALASREGKFGAAEGATRPEAEAKALRKCGKDCEIAAWACTR